MYNYIKYSHEVNVVQKFRRNQRIGALMKIFTERPNHVFSYNYFSELFNAAKSTISEDIVIIKELVKKFEYGNIETISGAAGGVVFVPYLSLKETTDILNKLCSIFSQKDRIIPGGYVYMTDIFNNPYIVTNIAKVIVSNFRNKKIDYVVTVETKGIPIAIMTAQKLDIPFVVIRRNNKVTEGATLSINYVSGSSEKIQTMSLSRKALKEGSKVLIVDDFMKGGGTAKGITDLMEEFKVKVEGIAVVVSTKNPKNKLVEDYLPLLILEDINEEKQAIRIKPNNDLFKFKQK